MKRSSWSKPAVAAVVGFAVGAGAAILVSNLIGAIYYQIGGTAEAFYQECSNLRQQANPYWVALIPLALAVFGYIKLDASRRKSRLAVLMFISVVASPIGYWITISEALDRRYIETFHGGPEDVPSRQKPTVKQHAVEQADPSLIDYRIVDCDNKFGVRTFQVLLAASDGKNILMDSHGLNHLLHLDWILGTPATRGTLTEATGFNFASEAEVIKQDKASDAVLRSGTEGAKLSTECSVSVPEGVRINDRMQSVLKSTGMELKTDPGLVGGSRKFASHLVVEAKWLRPFDKNKTVDAPFYPSGNDKSINVRMMNQAFDKDAEYSSFEDAEVIRLPYRGGQLGLYVILPAKKMSLAEFSKVLTPEKLESWMNLEQGWTGDLSLPQFGFDTDVDLGAAVTNLGLAPLFSPGSDTFVPIDASGVTSYIRSLTCTGKILVDEDGTKIETLTGQLNFLNSYNPVTKTFKMVVDHPFLLVLRDNRSKEIVCLGAFNAPSE